MSMKFQHQAAPGSDAEVDGLEGLIVVVPAGDKDWPPFPYDSTLKSRLQGRERKLSDGPFHTSLPNALGTEVALVSAPEDGSAFQWLTLARKTVALLMKANPASLGIYAPGLGDAQAATAVEAMIAAVLAACHTLPTLKSKQTPEPRLAGVTLFAAPPSLDLDRTEASAAGNNLARDLTALPANALTPETYRTRVKALAEANGWQMEFFNVYSLKEEGAGAFLAVVQGSPNDDAGIVHLRYEPAKAKGEPVALVGKGICFDTGGTNLKSAKHMYGMHVDMEGSAVALGTLLALTRLQVDYPVDCWLALAENHIGPQAYRQNEVVTASNGTTIEVVHTDAEGRMVLADTLVMASRRQPRLMIDFATLTGTCIYALNTNYSGGFSNREALNPVIIEAGRRSGERVWPFPMDGDYDEELESEVADIKQCAVPGEADHILAARFLSRFVAEDIPWVHVDLSAGERKGGLGHVPTEITGFGVRFALALIAGTSSES